MDGMDGATRLKEHRLVVCVVPQLRDRPGRRSPKFRPPDLDGAVVECVEMKRSDCDAKRQKNT
jgi:hypothetical protein